MLLFAAAAATSCSVGFCRTIDPPACRRCGDDGGAQFLGDPMLQVWSVGALRPLPNRMHDSHMYICKQCDNSWRERDTRFSGCDVHTPHMQDDAAYLAYRRDFMAKYNEANRQAGRLPSELYEGTTSHRMYVLKFINEDSDEHTTRSLLENFRVMGPRPARTQESIVVACLQNSPHTVVAYNTFDLEISRVPRGDPECDDARVDLFRPEWYASLQQRSTHEGCPWHERSWLNYAQVGSCSIKTLLAYRGDGLATALKIFQERVYPHDAIYTSFWTQVDNTAMHRTGAKAGYFQNNCSGSCVPTYKWNPEYVKPLEPTPCAR